MDLTEAKDKKKFLIRRQRMPDGAVAFTVRKKPKRKKVITARGKGEHTVGNVIVSQIDLFKPHMKVALKQRGYNVWGVPFKEIVPLYYNEFVSNPESQFAPINSYEFRNNPAWKIRPSNNYNGDFSDHRNRNYFSQLDMVVNNIVSVFRTSKLKKQEVINQGVNPKEVLTSEELQQAKAAEKVERELEAKFTDNESVKWGSIKKLLFIGLGIWLAWYLFE